MRKSITQTPLLHFILYQIFRAYERDSIKVLVIVVSTKNCCFSYTKQDSERQSRKLEKKSPSQFEESFKIERCNKKLKA